MIKKLIILQMLILFIVVCQNVQAQQRLRLSIKDINNRVITQRVYINCDCSKADYPSFDGIVSIPVRGKEIGDTVTLSVRNDSSNKLSWVIISPTDQRVEIPRSGRTIPLVIAKNGDINLLQDSRAIEAIVSRTINKASSKLGRQLTQDIVNAILEEQSRQFGLPFADVQKAIRAWIDNAKSPYIIGLGALFDGNYEEAKRNGSIAESGS